MRTGRILMIGGTLVAAVLMLTPPPRAGVPMPPGSANEQQAPEPVPAFHREVPAGPLPSTLSPSQFADPYVQNAYAIAVRIKKALYQQPCYCHCDRSQGHGSLLDCFVSQHASGCGICMQEAFYVSEQLAKGKTVAQIRQAIIRGEWEQLDTRPYQKYPAPAPEPGKK
ncbi:MAG TPA: CYCXC family (seleno)protein [Methylomirabilota bacterium]|nr:CYCXC family (seleno)protein [Methylomirabilota bacterium]